ncbi:MAG: XTP/dITP diphosphatase [Planctomycetes bacterium]|nr:XTP/dITP diphosphatase [Planctomycetota bacterium]
MRTLVLGTNNKHKAEEIAPLLDGVGVAVRAAGAFGRFDPDETGATLEANAILKARAALELSKEWAIADDTGLEVDALGGRPGIYAARYAGEQCSFDDNINKLLGELKGVPDEKRTARFVCAIAFCRPGHAPMTFRASCGGRILQARRGTQGFGYDPVFFVSETGKTFAELSLDEKNRVSHRARAMKMLRAELENLRLQKEIVQRKVDNDGSQA